MLYPIPTQTRSILNLDGIWNFRFDPKNGREGAGFDARFYEAPLKETIPMPIPSAWNDLFEDQADRDFVGWVWYERFFDIPAVPPDEDRILRFGSATHRALAYVNGRLAAEHSGGFTPFGADVTDLLVPGRNRLTVAVCNILDYTTLPIGNYSEQQIPGMGTKVSNKPNFDFFNYAGLQRPVLLYSVPKTRIDDIALVSDYEDGDGGAAVGCAASSGAAAGAGRTAALQGIVDYRISLSSAAACEALAEILDQEGKTVARASDVQAAVSTTDSARWSISGRLAVPGVELWRPKAAYLYTFRVTLRSGGRVLDVYDEPFGVRRVEVKDRRFLINGEPFYFKGFGKHEDSNLRGRGLDEVYNLKDLRLIKWMGGNSFRTSHYCYSEEFMRLCDREGIVVIDEVPAVGLMAGFDFDLSSAMNRSARPKTWEIMACADAHRRVIGEMVARDKNHPCVVMWSVGNESESWTDGAGDYFKPMFELARSLDPAKRPVTCVLMQTADIIKDQVAPLSDVLCINRYYGWYVAGGDLDKAKALLSAELSAWARLYPEKPLMFAEYGADTVAGLHDTGSVMFTEEYQAQYYRANHEVFDRFPQVVGEHAWNFADFATAQNLLRVQGNKKGLFTRERKPKQAVFSLKERWEKIPDLGWRK